MTEQQFFERTGDVLRRNGIVVGELAEESRKRQRILVDLHEESRAQRGARSGP